MIRQVQLHGGPLDGQQVFADDTEHQITVDAGGTTETYAATLRTAGEPGNPGYREWYRWTHQPTESTPRP